MALRSCCSIRILVERASSRSTAILIQSALNSGDQEIPSPAGTRIARIGASPRNGNWPPHLHLQVISHRLGWETDFPGVALPSEQRFWKEISPNPYRLLGIPEQSWTEPESLPRNLLARRLHILGRNLSLSYKEPLTILRGEGVYLIDALGRRFVDCVNNVAHVGHCHPRVVEAQRKQSGLLNTNTRYLHPELVR